MSTAEQVREIVKSMAPELPAAVSDDQRLIDDLFYDSLRLMELTVVLERAFDLPPYKPEDLAGVLTVGAVVQLIEGATS
ncbi:acyl carrier protein [Antrihabitans stalactiti]|uniref:Acyl carrier protein n=1 Tax=Antrihabitans stalactiti TaxID=2584121 RepID=A0A848K892_9NOCA|nr:acyl carrier protein [Antrihabitans stalactiti]NMN93504.1 acyl carrier protein [Antrihabitans stalactiti]